LSPGAKLQAGEYVFRKPASVFQVFKRIARGDIFYYELVVPEGNNMFDIAASVRAAYTVVMDNARLAVDLAWLPFAILIGAEIVAWVVGGGGWFGIYDVRLRVISLVLIAIGLAAWAVVAIPRPAWRPRTAIWPAFAVALAVFGLSLALSATPRLGARALDPTSGRVLEIHTTQPGLQLYTGNKLNGSVAGRGGVIYRPSAGFAFEPQGFPASPISTQLATFPSPKGATG